MLQVEKHTDKGLISNINQDAIYSEYHDNIGIFCVADGMGGHVSGELASAEIVESIDSWCKRMLFDDEKVDFSQMMNDFEQALISANQSIFQKYNIGEICGSTIVALIIYKDKFAIFSAGDSRVYLKHKLRFSQITVDDVWQNKPEIAMKMTDEEMEKNENFGKLTKAVGIKENIIFNRVTGNIQKGDIFFLCCDGVYKYISEKKLKHLFRNSVKLCNEINRVGAPDNYSFITVQM